MNKKKWMALALVGVMSLAMINGCAASGGVYTGNHDADASNYQITPGATRTSFVTDQMMAEADAWPESDDTAVAAVLKKLEAGEPVTIAAIGGSITQGTIARGSKDGEVKNANCYAQIFFDWFKWVYPNADIEYINAGIGGTDSYLGVHRAQADVLSQKPDLVLIEYAVNDGSNDFFRASYENLVRNVIYAENHPATILLFMSQTNGNNSQAQQSVVGANYKVPMLSYANVIAGCMKRGEYTAAELSGDGVHPSALGHAMTGEILWNYLNEVLSNVNRYGTYTAQDMDPLTTDKYRNATILDSASIEPAANEGFVQNKATAYFPNGWVAKEKSASLTFEVEAQNIGLLFMKTVDGKSGQIEVLVDGEKSSSVNADFSGGWGDAIEGKEVYTSGETKKHIIEIRFDENSKGEIFKLLGLLIS